MANVLLEAAASGRPIIASDIPGCIETFDDGISGFSCKPRDVPSLIDAISRFLSLTWEKRSDMGKAGRKKMELEFDRDKVIKSYIEEITINNANQVDMILK